MFPFLKNLFTVSFGKKEVGEFSIRDNKIEEKNTVGIIPNQIPKS
jgi:hypothetical protein